MGVGGGPCREGEGGRLGGSGRGPPGRRGYPSWPACARVREEGAVRVSVREEGAVRVRVREEEGRRRGGQEVERVCV